MFVSSFNLSQSYKYKPSLFYKKQFKSEITSFCTYMDPIHGTVDYSMRQYRNAHYK